MLSAKTGHWSDTTQTLSLSPILEPFLSSAPPAPSAANPTLHHTLYCSYFYLGAPDAGSSLLSVASAAPCYSLRFKASHPPPQFLPTFLAPPSAAIEKANYTLSLFGNIACTHCNSVPSIVDTIALRKPSQVKHSSCYGHERGRVHQPRF